MNELVGRYKKNRYRALLILVFTISSACKGVERNSSEPSRLSDSKEFAATIESTTNTSKQFSTQTPSKEITGPVDFPVITSGNAENLVLHKVFPPFSLEMVHIAPDGGIAAVGNLTGIKVVDLESNEILLEIENALPECRYGMDRYFQLNEDGNFLAVATKRTIQVWQIGKGNIYEAPYAGSHFLDPMRCGLDIPQLALSPDGKLLAESGIRFEDKDPTAYFRVVDLHQEKTIYKWDGRTNTLHGQLYIYPHLGFSSDGTVLQTFDPTRFNLEDNDFHTAFRFWSVDGWDELQPGSDEVKNAFSLGELLFGVSGNDLVTIRNKIDGDSIQLFKEIGCKRESPCAAKLSPDGNLVAIITNDYDALQRKRDKISSHLVIFNVSNGKRIQDYEMAIRNTDGFIINNSATINYHETGLEKSSTWWTETGYFSGFYPIDEETIAFIPQIAIYGNQKDFYTGTCQINIRLFSLICMDSITLHNNKILSVENKVEGFSISEVTADKHELITEIRNPNGESSVVWHIRLLEYISKTGTGFFCMDRNLREETCVIMDFLNNEILHERIDLKGFVYSRENDIGAFIDRKENTLFLYFEENENIKQVRTYQAIAQSIRPVILAGGEELIYVVQGLNKPRNLYIERIDLKEGKVIKRYDINELKNIEISSISARKADGVWAAADSAGRIYLVDPESEEVFHTFQASENGIIDMLFSSDGRSIIMMDRIGLIQVWIVGD